jgi:hypothetical protein
MEILDTAQPKPEVGTLLQVTHIIQIFTFFVIAFSLVRFSVMSSFFDSLMKLIFRSCGLKMGYTSLLHCYISFQRTLSVHKQCIGCDSCDHCLELYIVDSNSCACLRSLMPPAVRLYKEL